MLSAHPVCVCVCVCIYIYIYTERERETVIWIKFVHLQSATMQPNTTWCIAEWSPTKAFTPPLLTWREGWPHIEKNQKWDLWKINIHLACLYDWYQNFHKLSIYEKVTVIWNWRKIIWCKTFGFNNIQWCKLALLFRYVL